MLEEKRQNNKRVVGWRAGLAKSQMSNSAVSRRSTVNGDRLALSLNPVDGMVRDRGGAVS